MKDVLDLSEPIQQELEKFFKATDELEDKKLNVLGWKGPAHRVMLREPWTRSQTGHSGNRRAAVYSSGRRE